MSLTRPWHKLLSDDADDKCFEGFENTETCVAETRLILLNCATADFGNVDDDNIKEWIESDKKQFWLLNFHCRRNFIGD